MKILLKLNGQEWDYDEDELQLSDAIAIKNASGLPLSTFMQGIRDFDPLAIQTLIWFVRRRDEPAVKREQINFRIADLDLEIVGASRPTKASATTSRDAKNTSTRSRAGATSTQRKSTR